MLGIMGNTDANTNTSGYPVIDLEQPPLRSSTSLPRPLSPLPPPTPISGPFSDVPVSSVVALLIDAQNKLEHHRQLRWLKLDKFQNARSEYTTSLQTSIKEVEEQAKRRNRIQLASFLRQEARSREAGYARVEEVLAGLESRWQKAHDALAAGLGNVLLQARHEEQEWNEMLRRLAAEEQVRWADELPGMLHAAVDAWKTEDQAEESWRNAWETTNLTLERLSQMVQQQAQPQSSSSSQLHRRGNLASNGNDNNTDGQIVVLDERRKSIIKTRRMTETRRQIIEASTSTSTSNTSTSTSSSFSNVSVSVSVQESESQSFDELVMDRNDERHHLRSREYHDPIHHRNLQQQRQYLYSPIKNQRPGEELFDESLERISPDPKMHLNSEAIMDTVHRVDLSSSASSSATAVASTATSVSNSTHLHPTTHSASHTGNGKTEVNPDHHFVNMDEEHNTSAGPSKPTKTVSSPGSPVSKPQLQSQPQPHLRRTTSIKRAASSPSMKSSASNNSNSRPRVISTGKRTPTLPRPPPISSSTSPLSPSSSSSSRPSASTVRDGAENVRSISASNKKARSRSGNGKGNIASTETNKPSELPSIDTAKKKVKKESNNSSTSRTTPTLTPTPTSSSPQSTPWADYETRWRILKSTPSLTFSSIPWPVAISTPITDIEGIDPLLVAEFVLSDQPQPQPQSQSPSSTITTSATISFSKKRIRAALLRWHPDRFNATILKNVVKSDRKAVQDGVLKVVRILNDMLAKEGGGTSGNGNG